MVFDDKFINQKIENDNKKTFTLIPIPTTSN